ncbi:flagellar biosynthetic protein FliO [Lederbergia citrea]|uniref:flagellar biosynthetic protein FliO n=1 Tax=Lederbergia citrea TaxID=2833581 RepID=UPI001BC9D891|nr:flagellar biosynthetic protein FliO [Lederbergia citrea]MBS4203773.1 flagellar biosynthetic protein FliO [Lederbergia citrea]
MNFFILRVLLVSVLIFLFFAQMSGITVLAENSPIKGSVTEYMKNPEKFEGNDIESVPNKTESERSNQLDIGILDVLKMVAALIFVIALLYLILRFINKKSQSYQQNRLVQNFGGTPLGGNRSIQIVKVGSRLLVLGVGEDIRLLKEITDDKELEDYIRQYNEQLTQNSQHVDVITKWLKRKKEGFTKHSASSEQPFHLILKGELGEMRKNRKTVLDELELGKKGKNKDE